MASAKGQISHIGISVFMPPKLQLSLLPLTVFSRTPIPNTTYGTSVTTGKRNQNILEIACS